ncbi:MAG TPA: demethoxyubiquinone hydroxylase family protein [Sneathiellales bacterium]|jgi:ubiquinone biosynthesis monooxygenase Coq7|nr:demethoxyubiquinone hydroxylase family protein [Sneathiellales bacterium]
MSKTNKPIEQRDGTLHGDLSHDQMIDRFIRVDHAGEYGAARIYQGQLAVLGAKPIAGQIRQMAAKEQAHLERFDALIAERRVRPTVLTPLWDVAGFALGTATALMGEKAAMACTAAIEEVITEHYDRQAEQLGDDESALRDVITEFRDDEEKHRLTALAQGAESAPGYAVMSEVIKRGSRLAIWLSERL